MTDEKPPIVFVFGAARSGTTYLNRFLFEWFDVGTGPEGNFVEPYFRRLSAYGDLADNENLRRLIRDIAKCEMLEIIRSRWPDDIRFDVTPEIIENNVVQRDYAGVVFAVFKSVADGQNRSVVGNKYPGYWRHLDLLHNLFPEQGRFIGITRDGRDVAMSTMRTPWGERNAYACAKQWSTCTRTMQQFAANAGRDICRLIRYEDLLTKPEETVTAIAEFLGTNLSREKFDGAVSDARRSAAKHPLSKWRSSMSQTDIRRFESVSAPYLTASGYDVSDTDHRTGLAERIALDTEEFLFKAYRNIRARMPV